MKLILLGAILMPSFLFAQTSQPSFPQFPPRRTKEHPQAAVMEYRDQKTEATARNHKLACNPNGALTAVTIDGKLIWQIPATFIPKDVVMSNEADVIAFNVHRKTKGGGWDYAFIWILANTPDGWIAHGPLLTPDSLSKSKWIAKIADVSSDGRFLLACIAEKSAEEAPFSVKYNWEWWDVQAGVPADARDTN